jgi:GT2 family glycosyltransferase
MVRIIFLIPVAHYIPGLFLARFANVYSALLSKGHIVAFGVSDRNPIDAARNELYNAALVETAARGKEYDIMFWLDSDMMIAPAHVEAMLSLLEAAPDIDAVSAMYFQRAAPHAAVAYMAKPNPEYKVGWTFHVVLPTGDPTPALVDAVGFGCIAIRIKSTKEKLEPYLKEKGVRYPFWCDPGMADKSGNGEDLNFCGLMKSAGMKLVLLPGVVVPHANAVIGFEEYLAYNYSKIEEQKKEQRGVIDATDNSGNSGKESEGIDKGHD